MTDIIDSKRGVRSNESVDLQILKQYSKPGPRYTSYPAATSFTDEVGSADYASLLRNVDCANPVSLYFHIPFCRNICFFCACSVIYTRNKEKAEPYIGALIQEMDLVTSHLRGRATVEQLHWGGGTPSFLSQEQMNRLMAQIYRRFDFVEDAEISIELDPRETSPDQIAILADLGFNRASLGVQDFDPSVQAAINRIQPLAMTQAAYETARKCGFRSVNFDLIYGLPLQTAQTFDRTLEQVIELKPDRVSLFNFAYVPWLKKHQGRINAEDLPSTETRLAILSGAVDRLQGAGYEYIGMDHFALPDDELSRAQRDGSLRRNFQGYSTRGGSELIGFGATSIGEFTDGYAQNTKSLVEYYRALSQGILPTERGLILTHDDRVRKAVIRQLITGMELKFQDVEHTCDIDFKQYFARELEELRSFEESGMLTLTGSSIRVEPMGRFVIRNICMVFDAHLGSQVEGRYSKTV
jgi:oxygen-independent coproporphyrinogen-3 oxidase